MKYVNDNLKLVRNYLGLNQIELAEKLGISQALISQIETGVKPITEEIIKELQPTFDNNFFLQKQSNPNLRVHYRISSSIAKRITDAFEARLQIISNNIVSLLEIIDIPAFRLPEIDLEDFGLDAKYVASEIRSFLGVGNRPIEDLVSLLEKQGVIVHFYDYDFVSEQTKTLDGVSFIVSGVPVILVNNKIQNARKNFTIAHELGHIIMHLPQSIILRKDRDIEKEANEFASEFLAPASEIRPELINLSIDRLFMLKYKWKLSAAAILYKAKDLVLTQDQFRRYIQKMAPYRKHEPQDIDISKPMLLKKMFDICANELGGLDELTQEIGINRIIYRELYKVNAPDSEQIRRLKVMM